MEYVLLLGSLLAPVISGAVPTDELLTQGGDMEGFQLWVNLPAKDKMMPPRYQDTPPENIPVVETSDGSVRVKVIAGTSLGKQAVIETRTAILFLDIYLQPHAKFLQPVDSIAKAFAYVHRGAGSFGPVSRLALWLAFAFC